MIRTSRGRKTTLTDTLRVLLTGSYFAFFALSWSFPAGPAYSALDTRTPAIAMHTVRFMI
jgi:hypothetical protein